MSSILQKTKQGIKKALKQVRSVKLFQHYHTHLLHGRKVYLRLAEKYGEDTRIYINHYPGTGDVFITSSLVPAWAEKEQVSRYVVTVIGKSAYKVAKMFPIENVEILSQRDTEDLIHYLQTIGETEPNIEVLHFSPFAFHQRIMESLLGVNGSSFLDMYMDITFRGLSRDNMLPSETQTTPDEIDEIFKTNGLTPGKTVLLVPYANTINLLRWQFWDTLAYELTKKGYTVCTNCDYPKEREVRGTIPLFLRYNQLKQFVETAGTIIQLRSGLTDLLYNCKCKNYVLYPIENYYKFGLVSLYDYFALGRMKLSRDAVEIEFRRNDESIVRERILREL